MCGILGEISNQLISQSNFKKLLNLSIKRGPDQQGIWKDEVCQLGFNRLSIIDLSLNGNQPLISPSQKFAMVFNGEVYNYKEIQTKYNIADSVLRSSSDSEVLIHLIEKVDIQTFSKQLNGMFAIAIYDIEKKVIHLIRDFAGIKPLFYGVHENGIVFASQFDQIFSHEAFNRKILRPEIMKEYFGIGYMQAPNTVFKNIFQVEPGQIISFDFYQNHIASKQFYFEWNVTNQTKETSEKAVLEFENIFNEVIKSQLNADVPVASFLSGGIDSPLVIAFAKQFNPEIKGFTFGIDDTDFNESDEAQKIANQLNVKLEINNTTENEIITLVKTHFDAMTEPFGDYSSVPTFLLSQKARKFATVMLSGDGGDEVFWGYPRFNRSLQHLKWFKIPLIFRKIILPFYRKIFKSTSSAVDKIQNFEKWILQKQIHITDLDTFMPNYNFSKELKMVYKFEGNLNKHNAINYLKKNEFHAHLQKILRKVDLMSMANSIEVRVPFLDKRIIEFSNTIYPEYGINHIVPKLILRKSLSRHIDKSLTDLPKKGFSVPISKWLKNNLRDDFKKTILDKPIFGNEFFDENILKNNLTSFFDNSTDINPWGVWHIYAWQKWACKYKFFIK